MLTAWGGGNLLVMNSAEPGLQGNTQGLVSVLQALAMAVFPTLGGAVWNASLALPGAWHPRFCYACLIGLGLASSWLGCKLPKSLEKIKDEPLRQAV